MTNINDLLNALAAGRVTRNKPSNDLGIDITYAITPAPGVPENSTVIALVNRLADAVEATVHQVLDDVNFGLHINQDELKGVGVGTQAPPPLETDAKTEERLFDDVLPSQRNPIPLKPGDTGYPMYAFLVQLYVEEGYGKEEAIEEASIKFKDWQMDRGGFTAAQAAAR